MRTLIVMRHGKSDWSVPVDDRHRPLTRRGRRQAAEAGRWLAAHAEPIDLAVVSPAVRAMAAWELAAAELAGPVPVSVRERAYTFHGQDLLTLVRELGDPRCAVLVSHNPACEELVRALTGEELVVKTSGLVEIELGGWTGRGRVRTHGRPPGTG